MSNGEADQSTHQISTGSPTREMALEINPARQRMGIRELRNQLSAAVRRAGNGTTTVITIGSVPVAQLGPIVADTHSPISMDDLIDTGQVIAPARAECKPPQVLVNQWSGRRLDLLMREIRG